MVRRDDIEFPRVWRTFEKVSKDGRTRKFRVQDLQEAVFDDVVELMKRNFLTEEPFTLATGILVEPGYLEQMVEFWRKTVMPQRVSLVCFEEKEGCTFEKPEVVACNFLMHSIQGEESQQPKVPEKLEILLNEVESRFDIFNTFKVNEYISACGLVVNPAYRGMNIGAEVLRARESLCKEMGIKVSETIFSVPASQNLATKAGFETLVEIEYEDVGRKIDLKFPEWAKVLKVMTKTYN